MLNLWHTFNADETATLNRLLADFGSRHPDWGVQSTVIPFGRAQNEFRRAALTCGPESPDVIRAELPWVAEFASRGLVHPVPNDLIPESAYLPQAREAARYRGRRYMLPASLDCLALLYNKALVPTPPSTQVEFLRLAQQNTRDQAGHDAVHPAFDPRRVVRWGFYVRGEAYWFLPFLWAAGGALLDPGKGQVFIHRPEGVAALTQYRDLVSRYHVAPPWSSPSDDYEDMMQRFGRGEVAMIVNGPWAIGSLLSKPAFRAPSTLAVAPFPQGQHKQPTAPLSGHGYLVSQCTRHRDEAFALAAVLSGIEAQVRFARESNLLPSLTAAYHQAGVRDNRFVTEFRAALSEARTRPRHPTMARIFDDFTPAIQAVLLGDATPKDALDGVARAWTRLIEPEPASKNRPSDSKAPASKAAPAPASPGPGGPAAVKGAP